MCHHHHHHQNAWTTEVRCTDLIRLVWSRPVARSHSWWIEAAERRRSRADFPWSSEWSSPASRI